MTTRIQVQDASCEHCRSTIESAVAAVDNVKRAELDLSTKILSIDHGESMEMTVVTSVIRDAGYTPEPVV